MTPEADDGLSGPLRKALAECAATGLSGRLLVTGDPGGLIHLAGGGVAAIATPGAPSAEVILLRSHRISDVSWDAAFAAAAAAGGPISAELVARSVVGAGELEALLRTALADAMFVLATGLAEECRPEPGPLDCLLPLEPPAEADLLLAEAGRRARVLAARHGSSWRDRTRVVAAPRARWSGAPPSDSQQEILALADGRRTARDIAFATGRGVYATMLQLAQLREAGVLTVTSRGAAAGQTPSAPPPASPDQAGTALPQRRNGLPRRTPDTPGTQNRAPAYRLLRQRPGKNASPEDAE